VKDWFSQNLVPAFMWAATKILLLEYLRSKRAQKAERELKFALRRCAPKVLANKANKNM